MPVSCVQMVALSRQKWKPDSRGYYTWQLGWERSKSGKLQQHKFILGMDRKDAERRERKLRELWDSFCNSCEDERSLGPEDLLIIAKRIAKGTPEIPIPRGPSEKQHQYASRIQRMQAKYPVILLLPEVQHAYEVGQAALELFEAIPHDPVSTRDFRHLKERCNRQSQDHDLGERPAGLMHPEKNPGPSDGQAQLYCEQGERSGRCLESSRLPH